MASLGPYPGWGVPMTKRKILLIEDEESIAEPLGAALEREGFDVVTASTAAEGREAFRARAPDLVLLDVMLPDGDGRDVLRDIRSSSRVPVVMLTARGQRSTASSASSSAPTTT
jgi:DNA-binding response OmpR family regulator